MLITILLSVVLALYLSYIAKGRVAPPMFLDGVLLALYLWRPGTAVLVTVAFLGSVRHIAPWAREVALMFRVPDYAGWTLHFWLFLLPSLREKMEATGATIALPPMVQHTAPPPPIADDTPMLLDAGLRALNTDPTAPHVGVIGATRLGKTTFVGILLAYRQGDFVIATPKAAQYDPWFGADVARPVIDAQGDTVDYSPIERAVSSVHQEMLRRNTPGVRATNEITLVIDEWTQVVSELPSLAKKVINLLRMGAGCGIRLILMATDVNVRGWKMDGNAGVLDNLVFARVEDGRRWSVGRLDPNWRMVAPRRLDTGQVQGLAARVSLAGRGWVGGRHTALGLSAGAGVPTPPISSVPDRQTNRQTELVNYLKAHPDATRDQTRADGVEFDNADFGLVKNAIRRGLL